METRRLTSRDDFGFVDRKDEAATCSGGLKVYCPLIDDASVYYKVTPQKVQDQNYQRMWDDALGFRDLPTGRIPAFYRALYIQRRFMNLAGRLPTVGEMASILSTVDNAARGASRVDDAWSTDAAIRIVLKLPLDEGQKEFSIQQTGKDGSGGGGDTGTTSGGSSTVIMVGIAVVAAFLLLKAVK